MSDIQHSVNNKNAMNILRHFTAVTNAIRRNKFERTDNNSQKFIIAYMGQAESSPNLYSNSERVQKILEENDWSNFQDGVEEIDFGCDDDCSKNKYVIKLDSQFPANCNMSIIFPNLDIDKQQILWVNSYLGGLNNMSNEINARIKSSNRDGVCITVTSGDTFYNFVKFVGNLYLFWCVSVNKESDNNKPNTIFANIPVLIETNGQMKIRNIYLFGVGKLNIKLCTIFPNQRHNLFCCETDCRKDFTKTVNTYDTDHVTQITSDLVVRSVKVLEDIPFEIKNDDDLLLEVDSEILELNEIK